MLVLISFDGHDIEFFTAFSKCDRIKNATLKCVAGKKKGMQTMQKS